MSCCSWNCNRTNRNIDTAMAALPMCDLQWTSAVNPGCICPQDTSALLATWQSVWGRCLGQNPTPCGCSSCNTCNSCTSCGNGCGCGCGGN